MYAIARLCVDLFGYRVARVAVLNVVLMDFSSVESVGIRVA